ncbi:MAG: hypothetical protein ABIK31_06165 [candidate division WOR-3 bacterium]
MKNFFILVVFVFIISVIYLYSRSKDILNISRKTDQARRDAIVEVFEKQLTTLEANFFELSKKNDKFTEEDKVQYENLQKRIDLLNELLDELEDTHDEIRWKILRQRFFDKLQDTQRNYLKLASSLKKRK